MLAVCCSPAYTADDSVAPMGEESAKSQSSEQQELVHRILQQSQAARHSLEEKRVDEQTRAMQQHVVDDLAKLIELLKKASPPKNDSNPPPNSNPNPNSQPKPDSGSGSSSSANQRKNSGEQPASGESSSGSAADSDGGKNREQPEDSEERHGESRAAKARADRKLRLESDVWGHLPPALREKLLNNYGERMLPQYEEFVRKFYDALSEPTRSSKR
jgi:hypothetical protein